MKPYEASAEELRKICLDGGSVDDVIEVLSDFLARETIMIRMVIKEQFEERHIEDMLNWRNIDPEFDVVCSECQGSGVKEYASTSTWRGGGGGCAITSDVCDKCWGSGKTNRPGVDLRRLTKR